MRYPILALISIGNRPRKLELWQPAPWFWGKNGQFSDQTEHTEFEMYSNLKFKIDYYGFTNLKCKIELTTTLKAIDVKIWLK